ncbi:NACHT domain-containing protein [Streptomyces melanogenes]|uniref:NACHT domain-containing protein n=1 Tax=Streptomyces melanogenes TaxID=67326 RepID=A0ABZ1XDJ7_9ACTN|nr:NACHT domain-containing protein [Streptomyces melanogenes]
MAWALCAVVTGGLMSLWAVSSPDQVSAAASVVGTAAGLLGVLAVWAWRGTPRHQSSDTAQIAETGRALARMVRRQWEDEGVLRQLFAPAPLPVVWVPCRRVGLADRRRERTDTDAVLVCHADDPDELIGTFRRATHQRLVVLGPAGSGKTTFAVLLLLALLRTRAPDDPVPVLCPLASFDPARENARDWLQRRVTEDYPALGDAQRYGTGSVVELLTEHRVVPVLDGLDEVPPARRTAVLTALDETLPADAPLVLTCRTDAYAHAVRESAPLAHATVLEPAALRIDETLAALRLAAAPERHQAWDDLAEHLVHHPDAPAAAVLTSPLMATLARSVYADGDRDPAELADPQRFPSTGALERHLLDTLIPTLYERARRQDPTRRWDPAGARRHLTFLAHGLTERGTFELLWWKLHTWSPSLVGPWRRALVWLAIAVAGQLLTNPFMMLLGVPWWVLVISVAQAFAVVPVFVLSSRFSEPLSTMGRRVAASGAVALGGGLASAPQLMPFLPGTSTVASFLMGTAFAGSSLWLVVLAAGLPVPPDLPGRGRPSTAGWRRRLPGALGSVVGVALSCGLFFASYAAYVHHGGQTRFPASLRDGLVIGAVLGAGLAFLRWIRAGSVDDDRASVEGTLRSDRLLTLLGAAACALLFVLPDAGVRTTIWFTSTLGDLVVVAAFRLLDVGGIGLVLALGTCAWPYYTIARLQFAVRGQLPWRLQAFLADAHRLGILRRVGSTYQFRHARLQQHLADGTRPPGSRPPADLPGARTGSPAPR